MLCAPDGMPIRYEPFAANTGERDGARQMLDGLDLDGYTVLADLVEVARLAANPHSLYWALFELG